jgi:uncharacterized protein
VRIPAIDLARGWALLGVALVNVHAAALGWDRHYALDVAVVSGNPLNVLAELIVGLVFSHRSFPLLAFLLGYGIVKQWQSLSQSDAISDPLIASNALSVLRSRYAALLIISVVNGLLFWPGDILGVYAVMVLVALLKWPHPNQRVEQVVIALLLAAAGLYLLVTLPFLLAPDSVYESTSPEAIAASSFAAQSLRQMFTMHAREYFEYGLVQLIIPEIWMSIYAGMWVAQRNLMARWLDPNEQWPRIFTFGFVLLAVAFVIDAYGAYRGGWDRVYRFNAPEAWMYLSSLPAIVGSVLAVLAVARTWAARPDALHAVKSLFIAAGKTPLTQFIGQSISFAIIFNKSMIGWHGELGRAAYSAIAIFVFVALAGFARAWLAAGHSRGPMETGWMWLAGRMHRSFH